jgi:hypothetical protein
MRFSHVHVHRCVEPDMLSEWESARLCPRPREMVEVDSRVAYSIDTALIWPCRSSATREAPETYSQCANANVNANAVGLHQRCDPRGRSRCCFAPPVQSALSSRHP